MASKRTVEFTQSDDNSDNQHHPNHEKAPAQTAAEHAQARREMRAKIIAPVPNLVRKLGSRINDLHSGVDTGGEHSKLFTKQEELTEDQKKLHEQLGYTETADGALEKKEGEELMRATEARHKSYHLVGNAILIPEVASGLPEAYQIPAVRAERSNFVEAAKEVSDRMASLEAYLKEMIISETVMGLSVRPTLKELVDMANQMKTITEKFESTPVAANSNQLFNITEFKAQSAQLDGKKGEVASAQRELESVTNTVQEQYRDAARNLLSAIEGEEGELNTHQALFNRQLSSSEGTVNKKKTNFFSDDLIPFETIQAVCRANENNPEAVISSAKKQHRSIAATLQQMKSEVMESSTSGQLRVKAFETTFPGVNLNTGLVINKTNAKETLIQDIYKALETAEETARMQVVYSICYFAAGEGGPVNRQFINEMRDYVSHVDALSESFDNWESTLADRESREMTKSRNLSRKNSELIEIQEYVKAFNDGVSRGGLGAALMGQIQVLESAARTLVLELGEKLLSQQAKIDSSVSTIGEALATPLVQRFLPEELRLLIITADEDTRRGQKKVRVLTNAKNTSTFFEEMLQEAVKNLGSTTEKDKLQESIDQAIEYRDQDECTLLDSYLRFKLDEVRREIGSIGTDLAAALAKSEIERKAIYADAQEIKGRIAKFSKLILGQLSDIQDTSTVLVGHALSNLMTLQKTAQSVGITMDTNAFDTTQMKALAALEEQTGQAIGMLEDVQKLGNAHNTPDEEGKKYSLTVAQETDQFKSYLPVTAGDGQAADRIGNDFRVFAGSLVKAVKTTHELLHADAGAISADLGKMLTEIATATIQLCQKCKGFKNGLDAARTLEAKRLSELTEATEALQNVQNQREGKEFDKAVYQLKQAAHPDNPLHKLRQQLIALKSRLTALNKLCEGKVLPAQPELARAKKDAETLQTETIPTLEGMMSIQEERAHAWAEKEVAQKMDMVIQAAEQEVRHKKGAHKRAKEQTHVAGLRFAAGVSATTVLLDAQRALYTAMDASEVFSSQQVASFVDLAEFQAKLSELSPNMTSLEERHGQEIHRVDHAEQIYEDLIAKVLNERGEMRETVGSDFDTRTWARYSVNKLLGLESTSTSGPVDGSASEKASRAITMSPDENLAPESSSKDSTDATPADNNDIDLTSFL